MSEADPNTTEARQRELRGVLPAGSRLRSYELISVLGRGAFGITYRARDTTLDRDVAIKEYLPTSLALRDGGTMVLPLSTELAEEFVWGRERFLDEARTLVKLEDVPAVVRVIDFLEANGTAYMVMALARGETLDQRLRRDGPLPPPGIERMLHPLLDGLEQVHEVGFLHRDIKPANIILDARGNPTLIDFGAARAAMAGRSTAMTAIFTPGYAAAEQFTSARQGPWTDIYGLSATLYHAITGTIPPSAFDRMLDDAYAPLGRLRPPGVTPGLLVGIDAGLAVRAKDRPQSTAEWRTILSATDVAGDRATVVLPRSKGPEKARTTAAAAVLAGRKRLALWAAAAAAALVILAGGAYLAFAPRSSPSLVDPQALKAEDLERLLTERRAADAAAAEKKKLEEEAERQADADAKAKAAADADLAKAREQRQKAEVELAKLKTDMEARRQAEAAQRDQAAAAARRALEEAEQRNKAETELAALRKADEEAKQQAAVAAAAQQQADEAAQRKVEAEMAALRQTEADAQKKAIAEAEAKRQADEALAKAQAERKRADEEAARQKAEVEARQRLEDERKKADVEAKVKTDADAKAKAEAATEKKAAEAVENALRLTTPDRQRLQVALTSLGFDTRGTDGAFGPRSREMIAAWQQKSGAPATGFVSAAQRDQLLRSAAAAITRWDEEQKKIEDDKKKAEEAKLKAEEEAKAKAAAPATSAAPVPPPAVSSAAPPAAGGGFDGVYSGGLDRRVQMGMGGAPTSAEVRIAGSKLTGTVNGAGNSNAKCDSLPLSLSVSPAGEISGNTQIMDMKCAAVDASASGRVGARGLQIDIRGAGGLRVNGTLSKR